MSAVSSFNFGPDYIRKIHKTATKQSPGAFTKLYIRKLQKDKLYRQNSKKTKLNIYQVYIIFKYFFYIFKFVLFMIV